MPALVAFGGCGLGGNASALELGDIEVLSALGQPLRASIAFALHPNEEIQNYCIYLKPGLSANGLPSIGHAAIAVSNGTIRLAGNTAIREPLLTLQLTVDCPYAANLSREYSVFVSPWSASQADSAREAASEPASSTEKTPADDIAEPRFTTPARSANRAPVAKAARYRVQRGDTLSGIAERVSGRTVGIWQAVDAIFAANPDSFIHGNKDLLKAGALLLIPDTLRVAESQAGESRPTVAATAATDARSDSGYAGDTANSENLRSADSAADLGTAASSPADARRSPRDTHRVDDLAATEKAPAPRPGDISLGTGSPFVSPVETSNDSPADAAPFKPATEVLPQTSFEVPATAETKANVRSNAADESARNSWSWLLWLGGAGIALILGLLLFGRALRERFGSGAAGISDEPAPLRRQSDSAGTDLQAAASPEVDFRFDEPVPDARVIALDGDLDAGTGFQDSGDIDVAQDFGFSASGDFQMGLDIEFSAEPAMLVEDQETDIIPTNRRATDTILVSEVPPSEDDETGEYDLSMIVDATQQPTRNTDETTKDLKAIELDVNDTALTNEDPYTMSKEVDYQILEQDYEEELTATQALSAELSKAARELVGKMNADAPTVEFAGPGADLTAELPQSEDYEITVEGTATMPVGAENDDVVNLGDTNVDEEVTTMMPSAENDAAAGMDIESATIDTRKMKAS